MLSAEELTQRLLASEIKPWMILLGLFLTTFILEDAATLSGAYLAAEGVVGIPETLIVLIIGVLLGDWALFGMGRLARKVDYLDTWMRNRKPDRLIKLLGTHLPTAVVIARILPGTRLTGYTLFGFLGLNFRVYAISCFFCVIVWTAFLFSSGYGLGTLSKSLFGEYQFIGFVLFAVVFMFIVKKLLAQIRRHSDGDQE